MVTNFVLFQIGWFACVLGAANDMYWLGPATSCVVLAVFYWQARKRIQAVTLTVIVAAAGSLADGLLTSSRVLRFEDSPWSIGPLPLWMFALWAMFATTLDMSMRWLQRRLLLSSVLGAIVGPIAYAGAERLGAVRLGQNAHAWIALEWCALMVVGCALARPLTSNSKAPTGTQTQVPHAGDC